MTWVVGINSIASHSILVSDIQVTFSSPNGTKSYQDCLQKVYPLGTFLIGGFAGSVKIGFSVLGQLQRELSNIPENHTWDLPFIANTWLHRAIRRVYRRSEEIEKRSGCQIIIAGTNTKKPVGNTYPSTCSVYSFSAPQFRPLPAKGFVPLEIGSGSLIPALGSKLADLVSDLSFHQISMGGAQAQGRVVGQLFYDELSQRPIPGISKYTQIALVRRGAMFIFDHNFEVYPPGCNGVPVMHAVPPLAKNYSEFLSFCRKEGLAASAAVC